MPIATTPAERAPGHLGAGVARLVWLRSMTACDHVYLESAGEGPALTYGELCRASARWDALLDDLDVVPGQTVGVAVSDPLEFAVVFLGVLSSGRWVAPLDASATDAELAGACARGAPRLVVADRPPPPGVPVEWVALPHGACYLAGTPSGALAMPRVGSGGVVLSTSGTTGAPKVIRLDEVQLLHTAGSVAAHLELSSGDRGFNPLPLFHINAEVVGLLATLIAGATLVLDDRFHRRGFWAAMERHRATWLNAVPAILARLAVLEDGERVPSRVRFARSASAPLPVAVLERFERVTGIPVVETYGMTEAASQITANPLHGPRKAGSAGLPVGTEVRVAAGDGVPASPGQVGRVGIRGPSVIRAYSSPGYDDRVDADGWLETGDLGYLDADGYLFLVGREDDVINRGGEKIYPKEVEDVALGDASVQAVAVIGWDHEVLGRVPVSYLVLDGVRGPGDEGLAAELVGRVHERCTRMLSRPKRPVAYHVVKRLPQGATGKVRRRALTGVPVVYSLLVR
jgi:oxalate---CoA ligase